MRSTSVQLKKELKNISNMLNCKHKCLLLAIFSLLHTLKAASIHSTSALPSKTSTSAKPATLLLPPGFDSQMPPRQPMLYPFVVSTTTVPTTAVAVMKKSLGPFITPGWIPISSSSSETHGYKDLFTLSPSSTALPALKDHHPEVHPAAPILEDRSSKYILSSNDNGPVFESIIYGTWKPDPPLQPVDMLNATTAKYNSNIFNTHTTTTTTSIATTTSKSISNMSDISSSSKIDGKVSTKTINRQHGGFIDNKQQKIIVFENQSPHEPRDSHDVYAEMKQRAHVPTTTTMFANKIEPKQRKFAKKQGRQKIRSNSSGKTPKTTTTTTTTTKTTTNSEIATTGPIENTEQVATTMEAINDDEVKHSSTNVPMGEVRQINDSIEIKYNHKQTSRHSIEVTAHEHYKNHRLHDRFDAANNDQDELDIVTAPTTAPDLQPQEDSDYEEDDGGSSVIRMNWPTDFMNTPIISSTSTEQQPTSDEIQKDEPATTTSPSIDTASAELPLALSSLNIPPSLWPKFPGNITKLGPPYTAENSLEEPALCVPITVQEHNMINSHEIVNIERVFCFPMPITKMPRGFTKVGANGDAGGPRSTTTTRSTVIRGNIQNFEDFYEIRNESNLLKSHFALVSSVVLIYFKYIV